MPIFSNCNSKKTISDVIQPTTKTTPSRRTSKSNESPRETSYQSRSTDSSSNSYIKDSWKSSTSSGSSLSSLRDSLPENPHVYSFKEIFAATNKFLSTKHSSSSTSSAWRCMIRGDDVIVFQRKCRGIIDETELRERLLVICKSHHSSLVKLRGASISGSYIYLVYDYVKGITLAECLTNSRNPNFTILSDWISRVKIVADLAHGVEYIHNSSGLEKNFIHNHIKTSSVIITQTQSQSQSQSLSINAKICHFGTAELCGETERLNTKLMKFEGTRGYMSPEFQVTGIPTQKSDVYAFGVVILEILSGEEPLKYREENGHYVRMSLLVTAREALESGGVRRWMDKRLKDSFPVEVVEKMVKLGLECLDEDPDKRPDMSFVAGRVSKLYLESQFWLEKMGSLPTDFTVSMTPR